MHIKYFGEIADKTSKTSEEIENISNLNLLIDFLQQEYGLELADYQIAVNHELTDFDTEENFSDADEIAILSAFAGG